jgi:hypothetical protein
LKKLAVIFILMSVCCSSRSSAKISEKKLASYNSLFLSRVIEENPDNETLIRKCLGGMVLDGHVGIRLLDKFGLFLDNMDKKEIEVRSVRFHSRNELFSLFLVMKDRKDEQLYTMFIEYEYGSGARCTLKDIYFSIVFEERMKEIRNYFETR